MRGYGLYLLVHVFVTFIVMVSLTFAMRSLAADET